MKKIYYLGLLLLLISTANVKAQVTIGKEANPHGGALLDLQQPDTETKKGVKFPVVSLLDATQYGLTAGESTTAAGMIVYNDNAGIANGNGVGLYVWNGNKWNSLKGGAVADPCAGNNPVVKTPAKDTLYTLNLSQAQTLVVEATSPDESSLTYLWQSSSDNSTWTDVSDATEDTYSAPVSVAGTIYYRCNVTNSCGATASKVFTVTVRACSGNPTIITPATDITHTLSLVQAQTQTLSVSATSPGGGTAYYQWQQSSPNNSTWTNILNATADTYSAPTTTAGTIYYRCNVTNPCGTTASKVFTVNVCPRSVTDLEGNVYCTNVFGDAGEWTTQNLRSTRNDAMIAGTINVTTEPPVMDNNTTDKKVATYPQKLQSNKESMGLLYTWAAATNRTGVVGSEDCTTSLTDPTPHTQGICPTGWHLPSDKEWSDLERVIAQSDIGVYSDSIASPWTNDNYTITGVYRPTSGSGHGSKMKSRTQLGTEATGGVSNACTAGGFDGLFVGFIHNSGSIAYFGSFTAYWSSSNANPTQYALYRALNHPNTGVGRTGHFKSYMFSVRCKKN